MKIEPKFYKAYVVTLAGNATVICVTYNLDSAKQFVGIEYYEFVLTLPDSGLSIPSSRQANFTEELRVLHNAASTFEGPRNRDQAHIEAKLSEAYGSDAKIHFEEIDSKASNAESKSLQ